MAEVEFYQGTLTGEQIDALPNRLGNRNLLDNWYFPNPINQRGQTIYNASGNEWTVDRWYKRNAVTVSPQSDGLHLTFPDDGNLKGLNQPITSPMLQQLVGKTVTVSVLVKDTSLEQTSVYYPRFGLYSGTAKHVNSTIVLTGVCRSDGLFSATGVIPESVLDNAFLNFAIFNYSYPGTMTLVAAKLEIGESQTLAHKVNGEWQLNDIQDSTTELLKCQKYYLPLNQYVRYPATRWINSEIDFLIPVPVKMPKVPTIDGTVSVISGSTVQTGFTFTVTANGANAIAIRATKSSHGLTPANQVSLQVDQNVGCALSAEP